MLSRLAFTAAAFMNVSLWAQGLALVEKANHRANLRQRFFCAFKSTPTHKRIKARDRPDVHRRKPHPPTVHTTRSAYFPDECDPDPFHPALIPHEANNRMD